MFVRARAVNRRNETGDHGLIERHLNLQLVEKCSSSEAGRRLLRVVDGELGDGQMIVPIGVREVDA